MHQLKDAGVTTSGQKFTFIPDTTVPVVDEAIALQVLRLCESLEDDDDVQNVYSNLDISDEVLAKLPDKQGAVRSCARSCAGRLVSVSI